MADLNAMITSEKLSSVAFIEISLPQDVKEDFIKLKKLMSDNLIPTLEYTDEPNRWMEEAKDVLNDAVDVIEKMEFEVLRRQIIEKEYVSFGRKVSRFFSNDNRSAFGFKIAFKLKVILGRLDKIFIQLQWRDPDDFVLFYSTFISQQEFIDKGIEKARIIEMLMRQDDPNSDYNFTVIPIVELQTPDLAKSVYENERVSANLAESVYEDETVLSEFDFKRWVDVSFNFDVAKIVRYIHSSFHGEDNTNSLHGKKVLLILNGVRNIDINKWLELLEFLAICSKGSRVIIATDSPSVYSIITARPDQLRDLPEKDSLSMFCKYLSRDETQAERNQRLQYFAKEFRWRTFREIWETTKLLEIYLLSRHAMSLCLKQCFGFCSTFPMYARMTSLDLIAKWMALGFLQLSAEEDMELEDIGQLQFKELCDMGVFHCDHDATSFTHSYTSDMHPFIYRLACLFSTADCCIINTGEESIPSFVRHLRIFLNGNRLPDFTKFKKLRSIQIHTRLGFDIDDFILSARITKLRYLRIFDLHDSSFKVLPSSVGALKQLRYLNLSKNRKIKKLPDSICKLLFLQTLLLEGCRALKELPRDMSRLVSLRTLSVTTRQTYFPENGIGSIISLHTLIIAECESLISLPLDMRNCTSLRTLILRDCKKLDLATMPDEIVIEMSLQNLIIFNLPMTTALPHWIGGASHTLKLLDIVKCEKLVVLSEYLSNLVSLQKLVIKECDELLFLPAGMEPLTSLEHLEIENCKQLELASEDVGSSVLLKLQTIIIRDLPKATALPDWLQRVAGSSHHLEIRNCPQLEIVIMSSCSNDDTVIPEWVD